MSYPNKMDKQAVIDKWSNINGRDRLNLNEIADFDKRYTTAQLLENQDKALQESNNQLNVTGQIAKFDPVVIQMVRRITPQLIAYDTVGVQPLTMPTGLAFAIRARYPDGSTPINFPAGDEALFNKVDTAHSGTGTHDNTINPFTAADVLAKTGKAMDTAVGERAVWKEMGFTVDKVSMEAKTRQLRADFSLEVEKDMAAVHGLDATTELSNILTDELVLETNQEIIRTLYHCAMMGAKAGSTTTAGTFDLNADSDGRWSGERILGLWTFLEKEANKLALINRRGRGNFIITSADVATVLSFAGVLKADTHVTTNMDVNVIGSSYAGTAGRFKVFIDPLLAHNGVLVGYKGANVYDAGVIYAPYVPLQAHDAKDPENFHKAIGFSTRYAIAANPFTSLDQNQNYYYSKFAVSGI